MTRYLVRSAFCILQVNNSSISADQFAKTPMSIVSNFIPVHPSWPWISEEEGKSSIPLGWPGGNPLHMDHIIPLYHTIQPIKLSDLQFSSSATFQTSTHLFTLFLIRCIQCILVYAMASYQHINNHSFVQKSLGRRLFIRKVHTLSSSHWEGEEKKRQDTLWNDNNKYNS